MDLLAELRTRKMLTIIRARRTGHRAGVRRHPRRRRDHRARDLADHARWGGGDRQGACAVRPDILIGAGTVMTAAQADEVAAARAGFVVTPAITRGAHRGVELGLPAALRRPHPHRGRRRAGPGRDAVKIFPAKVYGPGYFSELLAPLPDAPLIAVGGVDAQSAPKYLSAGALAVGVSSPLLGDAGQGGSLAELAIRASTFRTELGV